MYEMKFKEMTVIIESELIKEFGVAYINLSKEKRCLLIYDKYIEILNAFRERQD